MDTTILATFTPELIVLGAALLVFLLDVLGVRKLETFGAVAVSATAIALLAVVADLGFAPLAVLRTIPASSIDLPLGPSLYVVTSLGLVFQAIFLTSALLVSLASLSRPSDEKGSAVFFGLLLMATVGMLFAAVASDLIFLLLAVEITGISTYLLVGYTRKDARSLEAAMKFYIVGALSSSLSFFGASLLFGAYGGTSFSVLARGTSVIGYPALALAGYALLLAGLGFKLTLVPFHAWAVDVYDGAPDDVSAFLAGGSKKIGVFAFFLLFTGPVLLAPALGVWCPAGHCSTVTLRPTLELALGVLAVLTMTIGNLLALQQKEVKRLLAYSSISQAGYMLIGVAVGTAPALAGATLQVFAHVFMKAGAFLVVAAVLGLGVGPRVEDWKGLARQRPYLMLAFALMLLSLAGIPLTIGFVSKFVLFSAAVQAEGWFVWLAVAGLLNSALSVFYYARFLKTIYLDSPPPDAPAPPRLFAPIGYGRSAAIAIAVVAIVAFGIDPQPVLSGMQAAATHFVAIGA
ncbi:MAG: NADH-quinone oxidoreductase subunit N [Thermoplasmata archaeon]|nr:NADH-quinone oxidoreductase subunit N [Thermoplasmata archaeon]